MDSSVQPLDSLRAFRDSLYRCFARRADALFELADALLTTPAQSLRRSTLASRLPIGAAGAASTPP